MSYTIPSNVPDGYLASLPWDVSQQALGAGGTISTSRLAATAGWHGPSTDPETGARCIVRTDGPLADLVGERLRITYRSGTRARQVVVYCHDEQDFGDEASEEDLSLTRRAMLALAPLALDSITVEVEVMA
jgi:hypothetical protein